jgi:hypothetical protein
MRWLTTPELMARWIIGASRVEADGDRLRLTTGIGLGGTVHAQTFTGETLERGPRRLVRRYTLERVRTGPIPLGAPDGAYERTVTYDVAPSLHGCTVAAAVVTDIPGLPQAAVGPGSRAEERSLRRSLERLRLYAEGRRVGPLRRSRDSSQVGQPL